MEPPALERVGLPTVPAGAPPPLTPERVALPTEREGEGLLPLPTVLALLADEGIPEPREGLVVEREGLL